MTPIKILETYEQLKAVSDPFRSSILMLLIENAMTGQQLADHFELPRAKIHYHLKELEKNELIEIASTEEKGGIMQKFYQATGQGFYPSSSLFPFEKEASESMRQMLLRMVDKEKQIILSAPDRVFLDEHVQAPGNHQEGAQWPVVGYMAQFHLTSDDYEEWKKRYFDLMNEFASRSEANNHEETNLYYFHGTALEIDPSANDNEV